MPIGPQSKPAVTDFYLYPYSRTYSPRLPFNDLRLCNPRKYTDYYPFDNPGGMEGWVNRLTNCACAVGLWERWDWVADQRPSSVKWVFFASDEEARKQRTWSAQWDFWGLADRQERHQSTSLSPNSISASNFVVTRPRMRVSSPITPIDGAIKRFHFGYSTSRVRFYWVRFINDRLHIQLLAIDPPAWLECRWSGHVTVYSHLFATMLWLIIVIVIIIIIIIIKR